MFQASSAHLQEDTVVHMQHMVLSLSMRVLGGLSVHSLIENSHSNCVPTGHQYRALCEGIPSNSARYTRLTGHNM